ncbi:MAG: hypothetical protein GXO18_07040 [Aquificae bacterium]|nr:hypothetical protein [Aquificota bacterium]
MGRVRAEYIRAVSRIGATFKTKGKSFVLDGYYEDTAETPIPAEEPKYIAFYHPDIVEGEVELPPIKDRRTREILIKKKLSEGGVGVQNLLIAYFELSGEVGEGRIKYKVFGVPEEVYRQKVSTLSPELLRVFTPVPFAVASISKAMFPDKTVFHTYADEETLIMTVSRGKEVLYIRPLSVPSYAKEEAGEFLAENINMTSIFVTQRLRIDVDIILLSGPLMENPNNLNSLAQVIDGFAVPLPPPQIKGVNGKLFQKILPCCGALLCEEEYDFSPTELKEERKVRNLMSKLTKVSFAVSGILLLAVLILSADIFRKTESVKRLSERLRIESSQLLSKFGLEANHIEYYTQYISTINEARRSNPLNLLPLVEDLLKVSEGNYYEFSHENNTYKLKFNIEKTFGSSKEMTLFKIRLKEKLEELKKLGLNYTINTQEEDLSTGSLSMEVVVEKGI